MISGRIVLLATVLVLSGCLSVSNPATPTSRDITSTDTPVQSTANATATSTPEYAGYIEAVRVEDVPANATVLSANDSGLNGPARTAITAAAENGQREIYLTGPQMERVEERFPKSVIYTGRGFGLYVSYRDAHVRVRLVEYV